MKNRIVELIYSLKDKFSGKVKSITNSMRKIDEETERSARRIKKSTDSMGRSFASLNRVMGGFAGSLSVGMVFSGIKQVAKDIDLIGKASQKLGISTEALSKLGYAAKIAAVPFNQLETGIQRMVRRLSEVAKTGKGAAKSALARLNLDAKELIQLSPELQLSRILDQLHKLDNQAEKIELAQKIFDSEGVNLIRLHTEAIKTYGQELEKVGGVITQQQANEAAFFNDNMTKMEARWDAFTRNQLGTAATRINTLFELFGAESTTAGIDKINNEIVELQYNIDKLESLKADDGFTAWLGRLNDSDGTKLQAQIEQLTEKMENLKHKAEEMKNVNLDSLNNSSLSTNLTELENAKNDLEKTASESTKELTADIAKAKKQLEDPVATKLDPDTTDFKGLVLAQVGNITVPVQVKPVINESEFRADIQNMMSSAFKYAIDQASDKAGSKQ